jgi:hypothetical protein
MSFHVSLGRRSKFGAFGKQSIHHRKAWLHSCQQSRKGNKFRSIFGLHLYDTINIWLIWWNTWRMCTCFKNQSTWRWHFFLRWKNHWWKDGNVIEKGRDTIIWGMWPKQK